MPRTRHLDLMIGEIYAALCRSARAMLDWTRADLARESGMSEALIKKYETGGPWTVSATAALRETFRAHGIDLEIDAKVPPTYYRTTRRIL